MRLQARIKKDLAEAMKAKDTPRKEGIRVIMGEFGRAAEKDLSDDQVIGILKKLMKSEREVMERQGDDTPSEFFRLLESYLPSMATPQEIETWIRENIDFNQYNNKMQAMGPIMKHFGAAADGSRVKEILQNM